eukprot:2759389-Rhodomonas_salina.1
MVNSDNRSGMVSSHLSSMEKSHSSCVESSHSSCKVSNHSSCIVSSHSPRDVADVRAPGAEDHAQPLRCPCDDSAFGTELSVALHAFRQVVCCCRDWDCMHLKGGCLPRGVTERDLLREEEGLHCCALTGSMDCTRCQFRTFLGGQMRTADLRLMPAKIDDGSFHDAACHKQTSIALDLVSNRALVFRGWGVSLFQPQQMPRNRRAESQKPPF